MPTIMASQDKMRRKLSMSHCHKRKSSQHFLHNFRWIESQM